MEGITIQEVIAATGGDLLGGDASAKATGVSIDTRTLKPGDLFFALRGERTDGHAYVDEAIKKGASGIVIAENSCLPKADVPVVGVSDTLWALGDLASYYRSKFDVRVVAITGSVGKTTTKEMTASVLSRKWNVLKNAANFNNEIGVPLTLFQLDRTHEMVVLEMAMRGLGEIRRLSQIAKPHIGVITNIGISHIERLGSQGAIAEAKSELLSELPPDGIAILNAEDGYFEFLKHRFAGRIISFGSCKSADVIGARIKQAACGRYEFVLVVEGAAIKISIPVLGRYNVYNALAAAATGYALGVDLRLIREGLENFTPPAMRMELVRSRAGYVVLNDAYNASPASTLAALRTLQSLGGYKRRIAVLGDMLELGDYAPKAHKDVGAAAVETGVDMLIAVGELARGIAEGAQMRGLSDSAVQWFPDSLHAAEYLKKQVTNGDAILVKGSRAMKMEEIVRILLSE
ncbi:MAG: UDP-N-acetylmuramoyl-tripeptide--D-alanyl-D-alanine ligase [Armatimonadetes bacterium]|nr:UDP-N-acetylmuramoyl-tripeptide--D-alanyl-D-alanine ligase [Armatimonadota bacterium]